MPGDPLLRDRTALVTGAAKRIGRALALALADHGANVVVHYATSAAEAEEVRRAVEARGRSAWTVQADLADPDAVEGLVERASAAAGRPLDLLVNNASIFPAGRLDGLSVAELTRNALVNAWAPLLLARDLAAQTPQGDVLNLLDTRVRGRDPDRVAYWLSKRQLHDAHRLLAEELAPGIRVNAIAPGLVLPPPGASDAYLQRRRHEVPLKRHGGPDDVVEAALYLLRAPFVTGQTLYVDGGQHLLRPNFGRPPDG